MKKHQIKLLFLAIIIALTQNVKAQALDEKEMFFDAYYGVPNLGKSVLDLWLLENGDPTGITYTGAGPFGFRVGAMISEKKSFGLMVNYTSATALYHEDADLVANTPAYDDKIHFNRLSIMPTLTFHNLTESDKMDLFFTVGVGYRRAKIVVETTHQGHDAAAETKEANSDPDFLAYRFPVAGRISLGMRYFFNDNFGVIAELGIGGPVLSFGATIRLPYK